MIGRKRQILAQLGGETAHHRTAEIDAVVDDGPTSIGALCASVDPSRGIAIVTEGLINHFDRATTEAMWRRFATALARFPRGLYVSDLMLRDNNAGPLSTTFARLLGVFVRGRTPLPFATADEAERALADAGFAATLLDPRDFAAELGDIEPAGASRVRIVDASAIKPRA